MMSTVETKKAKKSAGHEAQSALKETIKDINQAIKSGQLTASKSTTQQQEQQAKAAAQAPDTFAVAYDAKGRAQIIVTAGGDTITARQPGSKSKGTASSGEAKVEYEHSKLKGLDINLLNLDETYHQVSYEVKTREKRAVITEVGNGEKSAELYLGKRAKARHMLLTADGTQVIEGTEGRLTIDPTFTKYLMQSKDKGSIYVDLSVNKMNVTFPDGLKQTYGVTTAEAALLRQGPVGFKINWLLDNNGNHRFQWSAIVAYSKLPS
jgi:outer membrane lipoprotein-sorting protein